MAAEKDNLIDAYLKRIKSEKEEKDSTFSWYLAQIRTLAKKESDIRSLGVLQEAQGVIKETKQAKTKTKEEKNRKEAREEMADPTVSQTLGSFSSSMLGRMVFYMYDAKYKDTLPYWDQFPLVFPISTDGNKSFLGINMHYLPPVHRAKLMAALMTLSNTTTLAPQTKLTMTYKLLNSSSKYAYFKPCIKKYLYSHIRSRIMVVNPPQWIRALFLPTANFMKNSEDKVWQDSINKIKGILYKK